jgi:membrane protein implicated in regulation of membrane protease activity
MRLIEPIVFFLAVLLALAIAGAVTRLFQLPAIFGTAIGAICVMLTVVLCAAIKTQKESTHRTEEDSQD